MDFAFSFLTVFQDYFLHPYKSFRTLFYITLLVDKTPILWENWSTQINTGLDSHIEPSLGEFWLSRPVTARLPPRSDGGFVFV